LKVQGNTDRADLVRCVDCRTPYEQAAVPETVRGCPKCGSRAWLALWVPLEESDRPARA